MMRPLSDDDAAKPLAERIFTCDEHGGRYTAKRAERHLRVSHKRLHAQAAAVRIEAMPKPARFTRGQVSGAHGPSLPRAQRLG